MRDSSYLELRSRALCKQEVIGSIRSSPLAELNANLRFAEDERFDRLPLV